MRSLMDGRASAHEIAKQEVHGAERPAKCSEVGSQYLNIVLAQLTGSPGGKWSVVAARTDCSTVFARSATSQLRQQEQVSLLYFVLDGRKISTVPVHLPVQSGTC